MNGETLQTCRIVIAAKHALKEKKTIDFKLLKYEKSIVFHLLPKNELSNENSRKSNNVTEWFCDCISRDLVDIKLLLPLKVRDRNMLGFSNSS